VITEIIMDSKTHTMLIIADSSRVGMYLSRFLQDEMKRVLEENTDKARKFVLLCSQAFFGVRDRGNHFQAILPHPLENPQQKTLWDYPLLN